MRRCTYHWEPGVINGISFPLMHCTALADTEHQHIWTITGRDFWASVIDLDQPLTDHQQALYGAAFKDGLPTWPT